MGPSLLLRLHGAAVWLVACAGDLGERLEQTDYWTGLRLCRRVDGGPFRPPQTNDGWHPDGGCGPGWAGRQFDPGHVLLLLSLQCPRIRLWRPAAEPGVALALVRQVARQGHGHRLPRNR